MKKKSIWGVLLSLVVTVAVLTVFGGIAVSADPTVVDSGSCGDNVTYTLYSDGLMEITGTGAMTDMSYDHQLWMDYKDQITSVTISEGVTHIGAYSFYYYSNIGNISIPSSVTSFGNYAFYYCKGITELTIPDSVNNIGKGVFAGWSNLETVILPDENNLLFNTIPSGCFSGCKYLSSIDIPEGIRFIESSAFSGCVSLTTLTLPGTVEELGYGTFCNTGLTTLTIPNGVESIPEYCFNNSSNLETVILPESIKSIGEESFGFCENLKSINIPNGVTEIPYAAFVNCESLESVTLPETLKTIERDAFWNCKSLKSVDLPNGLTYIGISAFGIPYDSSSAGLESINIPNGVTAIDGTWDDYGAFQNTNITSLTLPGSIKTIESRTFAKNNNLQSITFGEGTEIIDSSACDECHNIKTVVIPSTVTFIGGQAFGDGSSMTDIYCYANPANLVMYINNYFGNLNSNTKFHVPAQYLDTYKEKFPGLVDNFVGDADGEITIGTSSTHLCGHSITIDGTIGVNFYMTLGDNVLSNSSTAYMLFTINGKTQKVKVSEASRDDDYYIFRCNVVAKEMTDTITAQLYLSEGNPDGDAYTYTVRDYAVYILNHKANYSTAVVNVVNEMLNYGAAAQIYFNYNTSDLANSVVNDSNKPSLVEGDYTFMDPYRITYPDIDYVTTVGDVKLSMASLSLKSTLTLKLYFENVPEGTVFEYKDKEVATTKSGKYTVVTIEGINPYCINEWVEVDVSYGETNGTIVYNPLKYVYKVMDADYNSTVTWQLKQVLSSLIEFQFALSDYYVPQQ